jgi:hypothetical protein
MNKQHRYLSVSELRVGMVLANELLDNLGHVLLPASTILTANMIKAMTHHEIHQLSIILENAEPATALGEHEFNDNLLKGARLKHIFRHTPTEEPTASLMNYIAMYRLGKPI